jgi:NAD(P)-dependent dehydrogenase (short-subunit alcohol dehydrogenase family)
VGLLDGKVAIVTGAAGVIGADTSRRLAEQGARVLLTDKDRERLEAVTANLHDTGHEVAAHPADITDEASCRAVVAAALSEFGRLDVLDNNAGATFLSPQDGDLVGTTRELWDLSVSINVTGPMLLCKHAVPAMVESGGGSIVNISSGQSLRGDIRNTAYAAGKGALNALTRHIAVQYGPQGVRCNAVAPGLIVGEQSLPFFPQPVREMFESHCSVQRLGRPEDISHVVVFLSSEQAAYITGQVITVDGGITDQLATVGPSRAMALPPTSSKGHHR